MLLTLSTTHAPATDLGYLLHKNPARFQTFSLSFGKAHVFYPEATDARCTAALLLDVDPIALVRGKPGSAGEGFALRNYVNDRPYVASSFLSVAIADVFGTAMGGRSKERPELAERALPVEVSISALPCRGGEDLLHRLFGPLGYEIQAERLPLDETYPEWGESRYFRVRLRGTVRIAEVLTHVYVLVPVLDDDKHYWVGDAEVQKLLHKGSGWLQSHPEKSLIAERYLLRKRSLTRQAMAQLVEEDGEDVDEIEETHAQEEEAVERRLSLHEQRLGAVLATLRSAEALSVLDLGCGEGRLLEGLLQDRSLTRIVGMDVSHRALERAAARLHLDRLPPAQRERIELIQGSLMYRDRRLEGFDAATVVEVIEHLDPARLAAFERVLFEHAHPRTVVLTTPNVEYNVCWETLPAGKFRHRDHRFEWTREEFRAWSEGVAGRFGYNVRFLPVGPADPRLGPPSQMAVFSM